MIICKKCKKVVSYNSYFQKYICSCGWECIENSTKTDIEEDIKILNNALKRNKKQFEEIGIHILLQEKLQQAIENILADRERLEKENKILEDNYQMLSEDVSSIAKELNLEEDATIDEIYTAIRILKSKRI